MELLLLIYVGGGLLLAIISLPLIARKIPPNPLYGFRVRQTLDDPQTWYAVNVFAGKRLLAVGLLYAAASALLYFVPGIGVDAYALACLAVFVIVFLVTMVESWRYLRRFEKK